jgi:hypothetical protein
VALDPLAAGESGDLAFIEAAGCLVIDILDAGGGYCVFRAMLTADSV